MLGNFPSLPHDLRKQTRSGKFVTMTLNPPHSVLSTPSDDTEPIRLFHQSFQAFLRDTHAHKTATCVDAKRTHRELTGRCLDLMESRLGKNICRLRSDGTRRVEIDSSVIHTFLPPEVQYACHYWVHHLANSPDPSAELVNAMPFLRKRFLHWVEAMSLLGMVSEVAKMIEQLQIIVKVSWRPPNMRLVCRHI